MVAELSAKLEWGQSDATTQLGTSTRPQPIYRCIRIHWVWRTLSRCLDCRDLGRSAPPTFYPMEGTICNSGSNSDLGRPMVGEKIRFYCDNQAVVKAWQSKAPKNHNLANLYRKLFLLAAKNNFNISLTHIPGLSNDIADALSRQQMQRFRELAPDAEREPTNTPVWLTEL